MKETGSLKLYIIDATGKKVKDLMNTNNQSKGVFSLDFNMSNLPKGIYLGILETKDKRLSQKIIHN